ncbi:MAG: ArsR/SmtB family transcription factor [Cyanobium sp.]
MAPDSAAAAAVSTAAAVPTDAEAGAPAMAADQARQLLKALADPIRLEVVQALTGGERCVCELTEQLGLAQSRLSFHLRVLRAAGLLEAREQGRWVYYCLRPDAIEQLQQWLAGIATSSRQPASPCC